MKPIFLSDKDKQEILEDFKKQLEKEALYNGTLSFQRSWNYKAETKDPAIILYTPEAWVKTVMLLKEFDSEVAWHGLIRRGEEDGVFIVYDVMVYPQEVTGTTVNTDQEEYTKFLIELTEEDANAMHIQCHSHVNMSTSPSGVDTEHQSKIVKSMKNGFYVFQIWNKKLESTSFIYDMDNNIMYENKDIIVDVIDNEYGISSEFVAEAKKIVKKKTTYTPVSKLPSSASDVKKKNEKEEKEDETPWWRSKDNYYGYSGYRYDY